MREAQPREHVPGKGTSPRPAAQRPGKQPLHPSQAWDENADLFTTTVRTTVGRLRAKLGDPPLVQTVREGGYRIGTAS